MQLARLRGATVIGTAREENHDYLASLGAIPVAYGEGLLERVRALAPGGVDMVLDGAGGAALDVSLQLVKGDRIITLVEHDRAEELGVQLTRGCDWPPGSPSSPSSTPTAGSPSTSAGPIRWSGPPTPIASLRPATAAARSSWSSPEPRARR